MTPLRLLLILVALLAAGIACDTYVWQHVAESNRPHGGMAMRLWALLRE